MQGAYTKALQRQPKADNISRVQHPSRGTFQFLDNRQSARSQAELQQIVQRHAQYHPSSIVPKLGSQLGATLQLESGRSTDVKSVTTSESTQLEQHPSTLQQPAMARRILPGSGEDRPPIPYAVVQRMPRKNKKAKKSKDDDPAWTPKQQRYSIPKGLEWQVLKATAHLRVNFNRRKYKQVYTCRNCSRPLGHVDRKGNQHLAQYSYTSKSGKLHTLRALALDHYPTWSKRLARLEKRGASDQAKQKDFRDPKYLRAICKRCNESHALENGDVEDYESDEDEVGFQPGDDEPDNQDHYKDYEYDPPPGGGGITV